jgi:hypothetical protein
VTDFINRVGWLKFPYPFFPLLYAKKQISRESVIDVLSYFILARNCLFIILIA